MEEDQNGGRGACEEAGLAVQAGDSGGWPLEWTQRKRSEGSQRTDDGLDDEKVKEKLYQGDPHVSGLGN